MEDGSEIDLRTIMGVLRRRAWLILATFVLVTGLATVVVFSLKPNFTASALVLVDTTRKNLLDPADALSSASTDSARVESEVELAKSETVLLRVINDLKLFDQPEFAYRPGLVGQLMELVGVRQPRTPSSEDILRDTLAQLRDAVSVQRRGNTYLISIQVRSSRPGTASMLANAVAKSYISEQLQAKIDSTFASRDILQARLRDSSGFVAKSEDAIDDFIRKNIEAIEKETGKTDLGALNGQIVAEGVRRSELSSIMQVAGQDLQSSNYGELGSTLRSEALATLEDQRASTQSTLAAAAQGSQTATDLQAELNRLDAELRQSATDAIGKLSQDVSASQAKEAELKAQLRTGVLSSTLSSSTLMSIYEMQQTAEIARSQYQTVLTRLKDLDQQAYLQVADSRVASEATPPDNPSFPNVRLLLLLAAIAGGAAGVIVAFVYENFIGGVVSEDQLRGLVRTRAVLTVPRQKEIRGRTSVADVVMVAPLSVFSESLRKVRVAVDQALSRAPQQGGESTSRKGRVVLVSSSAPNEGKTTTALALARTYALGGRMVLLIDCDLRKPSLHKHLGVDSVDGLIDYLEGEADRPNLTEIVSVDQLSGMGVLLGSRRSNRATDQLVSGAMLSRLIDSARNVFDVIVLDTPPVGPVVDGVFLARFADAIVFVVKWATTAQSEVRGAIRVLADAANPGVEVVSVLSQSSQRIGSYYGKYASYYSEAVQTDDAS